MSTDRKDVELRIRAILDGKKNLTDTIQALDDLAKAQNDQIAAAKRGQASAADLSKSYKALGDVATSLLNKSALVETFEAQSRTLAELKDKVEAARASQQQYHKTVADGTEPTKAQTSELKKLARAVEVSERAQIRAENRLAATTSKMAEYGIAADGVAAAQNQIGQALGTVEQALRRQDKAIGTLDDDLRAHNATLAESLNRQQALIQVTNALNAAREKNLASLRAQRQAEIDARAEFEKAINAQKEAAIAEQRQAEVDAEIARAAKLAAFDKAIAAQREKAIAEQREQDEQQRLAKIQARAAFEKAINQQKEDAIAESRQKAEDAEKARQQRLLDFDKAIAAQREKAIAEQRQQAEDDAKRQQYLKQAAEQASAQAKGYSTLARTVNPVRGNDVSIGVQGILDPGGQAIKTLGGIEDAIQRVQIKAATAKGPLQGVTEATRELSIAQKSLANVAGQIDGYRKQVDVLRAARAEYAASREAVRSLVEQMRAGNGDSSTVQQLAGAQSKLKQTSAEMANQLTRTRELRDALRATGVQTNDLAGAQQRLNDQATRSVAATGELTAAVKTHGVATDTVTDRIKKYNAGQRTTLSMMQRIKGEALSLTATYIGLNAAMGLAKDVIAVTLANAKIQNGLSVLFEGDAKKTAEEFQYLKQISNEIGVSFEVAAKGYTKFAIGAKAAGFTSQETRFTFEQLSIAARNAGLSNEEYEGTLKAVEQMMSKGVIQAEELKGQLGDRLPGAVSILAKSMGKTTAELLKMMETGGVTARYVLNLATQYGDDFGKVQETAATRLQKTLNLQENATRDFKQALGEAGFIDAYTEFLQKLTKLLSSAEGKQLAQTLSDGFTGVIKVLQWAAENTDTLKVALAGLVAVKVFGFLGMLVNNFKTASQMAGVMRSEATSIFGAFEKAAGAGGPIARIAAAVGGLAGAFKLLGRSIPVIGALLTAYEVGSYLLGKAQKDVAQPIGGGSGPVATSSANVNMIPGSGGTSNPRLTENPGTQVNKDDAQLASVQAAIGRDAEGKAIGKDAKKIDTKDKASRLAGAKGELAERQRIATEELQLMRDTTEQEMTDAAKKGQALKMIDAEINKVRLIEQRNFEREQAKSGQAAANKRLRLAEELARDIAQIEDDIAKRAAKLDPNASLETRIKTRTEAIAHEYDKVRSKISQLERLGVKSVEIEGDDGAKTSMTLAAAKAKLDGLVKARQEEEKQVVQKEELERLEKRLADQQSLRTSKIEAEVALRDAGLQTTEQMLAKVQEINQQFGPTIGAAADELERFATSIKELVDPATYQALLTRVAALRAGNRPDAQTAQARKDSSEQELNALLEHRQQTLDAIQQQKDLGLITDVQAVEQTNKVNAAYQQQIVSSGQALIAFVDTMLTMTNDPTARAALESLRAKTQQTIVAQQNLQIGFSNIELQAQQSITNGLNTALDGTINTFEKVATGQQSLGDGFKSMGATAANVINQMVKDLALYIIKLQIAQALASSSNTSIAGLGGAMLKSMGAQPVANPALNVGAQGAGQAAAGAGAQAAGAAAPAVASGAGEALTAAATEAGVIQTAAATTAAATTATSAVTAATTDQAAAVAAAATEQTAAVTTAATDQATAATFAATVITAGQAFAAAVMAAAQAQAVTAAFHTGGIAGSPAPQSRSVNPMWFGTAKRFHSGGFPGLSNDEVPAVLQRGEEVLTRNDPRHAFNGGKGGGGGGATRFVLLDDRAKVAEALASAEGEKVIFQHLKRNIPTIKSWLR